MHLQPPAKTMASQLSARTSTVCRLGQRWIQDLGDAGRQALRNEKGDPDAMHMITGSRRANGTIAQKTTRKRRRLCPHSNKSSSG
jgi:hypothetical protein